jgi:hypothetical protein
MYVAGVTTANLQWEWAVARTGMFAEILTGARRHSHTAAGDVPQKLQSTTCQMAEERPRVLGAVGDGGDRCMGRAGAHDLVDGTLPATRGAGAAGTQVMTFCAVAMKLVKVRFQMRLRSRAHIVAAEGPGQAVAPRRTQLLLV